MKLTVDREELEKLVKQLTRGIAKYEKSLRLWACDARVFVGIKSMIVGTEALVLEDGGCTVRRKEFVKLIQSHENAANITIEANEIRVKVEGVSMRVLDYSSHVTAPAEFQVFPGTDAWIAGSHVTDAPKRSQSE